VSSPNYHDDSQCLSSFVIDVMLGVLHMQCLQEENYCGLKVGIIYVSRQITTRTKIMRCRVTETIEVMFAW